MLMLRTVLEVDYCLVLHKGGVTLRAEYRYSKKENRLFPCFKLSLISLRHPQKRLLGRGGTS
jgi:hypothetical protein